MHASGKQKLLSSNGLPGPSGGAQSPLLALPSSLTDFDSCANVQQQSSPSQFTGMMTPHMPAPTPSFAFPIQQHFGLGMQQQPPQQQSLLTSLANLAQSGISSALNPLLQAMAPSAPPMQLIPSMPAYQTPAYYTPQAVHTPMVSQEPTSLPPHILQAMLQAAMQSQTTALPQVPQQAFSSPPIPEYVPVPARDDPIDPSTSVPIEVVLKLLEMAKGSSQAPKFGRQIEL